MSYILDALKKSEQERQRGNVPDIKSIHQQATVKPEPQQRSRWWIYLFILVVLVNGAIFAVVYLGGDAPTAGIEETELAMQEFAPPSDNVRETIPQPAPAEIANTMPESSPQDDQQSTQAQPQPKVIFSKVPLDAGADSGDALAAQPEESRSVVEEVVIEKPVEEKVEEAVLIAELPENIRQKIPNMEFAGHVYSNAVERRSVMINGKKMREGDVVGSGLVLQKITPEGAEFEYQGYRFKLGALQDWSAR